MSFHRQAILSRFYEDRLGLTESAATAGLLCAALAGFFLLVLVSGAVMGLPMPEKNRFLLVWTIALGSAFASLFLAGAAAARGRVPVRFIAERPVQFGVLVGLLVLTAASMAGAYFLIHGRKANPVALGCPKSYQPFQARDMGFAFCHPARGWSLDAADFGSEGRGFLLRSTKDPLVKIHFRMATIPEAFIGAPQGYSESVAALWRKLDPGVALSSVYFAGKEAFYFEANFKDSRGVNERTQALHILLSNSKILLVNSSHFDTTPENIYDALIRVLSTITFAK